MSATVKLINFGFSLSVLVGLGLAVAVAAPAASTADSAGDLAGEVQTPPALAPAPVSKIFVPNGFDDNDNAEIVIKGQFPSTCYKTGPSRAIVDKESMTITLVPEAYVAGSAVVCSDMLISYTQTITLGELTAGLYTVTVKDQTSVPAAKLEVGVARKAAKDDYLYAPADEVSLRTDADGNDIVHLEGNYPALFVGCLVADEIRTDLSEGDVVVIQPVARIVQDAQHCNAATAGKRFVLEKKLSRPVTVSEFLLHVRTLNGTALNRIVDRPSSH